MPRRSARVRVDRGIYRDRGGFEVVAHAHGHRRSRRYPLDTDLEDLKTWRDETTAELRSEDPITVDASTIAGAIARYVAKVQPSGDTSQFNAWTLACGTLPRRKLTPAKAQELFDRWKAEGYSRQTLRIRRFALQAVWRTLDGPRVRSPVDYVKLQKPRPRAPVRVADADILRVLFELKKHEKLKWLRTPKTRARLLVLAATGQRPAQLKRARRGDVDLEQGIWWMRAAKGGDPIPLYLNGEMQTAWRAFMQANAWGPYDSRSFARTLRRAGWPAGVRPYNVRHATGIALSERGADLGDIQQHMGHRSITTTRAFYVPGLHARMRTVSATLEDRFDPPAVAPSRGTRQKR